MKENEEGNRLFPIFLKLETLPVLLVGGGYVAHEKLEAMLGNAPLSEITVVATQISANIKAMATEFATLTLIERPYETRDLDRATLIVVAINDVERSAEIRAEAKALGKLINVADKPALCDFYLSSIVKKGNLKIAISTNGKSPTLAKRIKEMLTAILPDELEPLMQNLGAIRDQLKGDFAYKVQELNKITASLVKK
jgi:siroheme synthase-like protein